MIKYVKGGCIKKYLVSLITVISIFLVVGCGKSNKLVGTWTGKTNDGLETTFEFKKDGSVNYDNEYGFNSTGTYEIKDDKVTISLESWDKEKVYEYSVNNGKLTLTATDKYSPSYKDMSKKS